jgi:hypothetical protein
VEATVPAASAAASGLPAAVDDVLRAGLAKEPSERPPTAGELVDRLERALGEAEAGAADPPTAPTRALAPVAAPPPRRRAPREARVQPPAPPSGGPRPTSSSAPVAPPRRRWGWLAALAALLLAAGAVAAIAMTSGGSGGSSGQSERATQPTTGGSGTATSERRRTQSAQSAPAATTPTTPTTPSTPSQPSTPAPTDPKELNDRGFALLRQGNAAGAVEPLQQSVQGFREQGRTGEIDYAYALFNLGSALRQSGRPGDAIPLLEERLKVSDYKRGVVRRELALAREQAGQGGAPATGRGNGDGNSGSGDGDD